MLGNYFKETFCDMTKTKVCATSVEVDFNFYTDPGIYEIYEDCGNGLVRLYLLTVDKPSDSECVTQTRVYCGKVESRKQISATAWENWKEITGSGGSTGHSNLIDGTGVDSLAQIVTGEEAEQSTVTGAGSVAFGKTNIVTSDTSIASGEKNRVGGKAFRIMEASAETSSYTLDGVDGLAVGDVYSVIIESNYDLHGEITGIDVSGKVVTVSNFVADTLPDIDLTDKTEAMRTFRVVAKPDVGSFEIAHNAQATGLENKALAFCANVSGYGNEAVGQYAIASGFKNIAAYCAAVFGRLNKALGRWSHVVGKENTATGEMADAAGYNNEASGVAAHVQGSTNKASGTCADAGGNRTEASGTCSLTRGIDTKASGANSVAFGSGTQALGENSIAGGKKAVADGKNALAFGSLWGEWENTLAKGENAVAIGPGARANGFCAKAVGQQANAYKDHALALGFLCNANAVCGTAVGSVCTVTGVYSLVGGRNSETRGAASLAFGENLVALGNHSAVFGKFNKRSETAAFQIGRGTSDANRKDLFAIDFDANGNPYFDFNGVKFTTEMLTKLAAMLAE